MAHVRVTRTVKIGNRVFPVKKIPRLMPTFVSAAVEAAATQSRVMAEEARELVLDRLFAAQPQEPGSVVVARPPKLRAENLPGASRAPFDHVPLAPRTALKKAREGWDGRFLIALGDYVKGIEVFKGKQASGVYYMVRMKDRDHKNADPSSGAIKLALLSRVLELGSGKHKIPPRPHWRPTIEAVLKRWRYVRKDIQAEALRLSLRRIG